MRQTGGLTFRQLRALYGHTGQQWMPDAASTNTDCAGPALHALPAPPDALQARSPVAAATSRVAALLSGECLQPGIHEWFYDMTATTGMPDAPSTGGPADVVPERSGRGEELNHEFKRRPVSRPMGHSHIPFFAPLTLLTWLGGRLCARTQRRYLFWIGPVCRPSIYILSAGLGITDWQDRCIFVDPADDDQRFWVLDQALRCSVAAAVMADGSACTMATSRRLQLAAQAGGGHGLFVRPVRELSQPSLAATRWLVQPHPTPTADPHWRVFLQRAKPALAGIPTGTASVIRWRYSRKQAVGRLIPAD